MTDRRNLTEREHRMWQRVSKTVRPMPKHVPPTPEPQKAEHPKKPDIVVEQNGHVRPRASAADLDRLIGRTDERPQRPKPAIPATSVKDKPGLPADRSREKRPRRGRVAFSGTLDLHGLTQDGARFALQEFLRFHREEGTRSVLVITGKGRNRQGVLRTRLIEWIAQPDLRALVSGYSIANQRHGGEGAFYLFLRRPDPKRHPFGG